MSQTGVFGAVLAGEHWKTCTAAVPTFAEALELVTSHFKAEPKNGNWGTNANLQFRVYKTTEEGTRNASIVEIGPDSRRPMMALAVYKIMEGQFGD